MRKKIKFTSLLVLIFICLFYVSIYLTSQTSKIPIPREITNTIINTRPMIYNKGKLGGVLTLGDYSGDPKTYNIIVASENTSTDIIRRFQISLMDYNVDSGEWYVYPGNHNKGKTGKGYDIDIADNGEQILTIYLRKDVFWTDGLRVTADDWVWYWNNIYANKDISPGGYSKALIVLENGDTTLIKAKKIDRWTFCLIFPRVLGEVELIANFSPMPKHILKPIYDTGNIEALLKLWSVDVLVANIVGNGPWVLSKYIHNETLIFNRNTKFFLKDEWNNSLPYMNKLIINIVPDRNTLYLKFQSREIDSYYMQNIDFKQIIENAESMDYSVWNGGLVPEMEFICFNQNDNSEFLKDTPKLKWFKTTEFRQAISYLIDRETLISQIHKSLAEPDITYFTQASNYFDSNVICNTEYNPEKALILFEKIGLRDRDGDGILEDINKNKVKFELNTNSGNQEREKTISILANEWKIFGILANPCPIEFNVLVSKLTTTYNWDSVMISMEGGLFPLDDNVYMTSGNLHLWYPLQEYPSTEWEEEVDKLHREAKYEADFETRKEIINEMFFILYEELPMIPLSRKYSFKAIYNKLANINWDIWTEIGGYNNLRVYHK